MLTKVSGTLPKGRQERSDDDCRFVVS